MFKCAQQDANLQPVQAEKFNTIVYVHTVLSRHEVFLVSPNSRSLEGTVDSVLSVEVDEAALGFWALNFLAMDE